MVETLFAQELTIDAMVLRLGLSLVVGGIVGMEREYRDQPAGFRTHTLISIGATLLMFVSVAVPHWYDNGDPGRIAAQVVSGIGFLGAGAIIKFGADIRGLTTAGSIWAVAAIGLGIGAGLYIPSAVAFVLIVVVLAVLNKLEKLLFRQRLVKSLSVESDGPGPPSSELEEVIRGFGVRIRTVDMDYSMAGGRVSRRYIVYAPRMLKIDSLIEDLRRYPEIRRVIIDELA